MPRRGMFYGLPIKHSYKGKQLFGEMFMVKIQAHCANCGFERAVPVGFECNHGLQQYKGQNKYILGGPCDQCRCQMFIVRIPTISLLDILM